MSNKKAFHTKEVRKASYIIQLTYIHARHSLPLHLPSRIIIPHSRIYVKFCIILSSFWFKNDAKVEIISYHANKSVTFFKQNATFYNNTHIIAVNMKQNEAHPLWTRPDLFYFFIERLFLTSFVACLLRAGSVFAITGASPFAGSSTNTVIVATVSGTSSANRITNFYTLFRTCLCRLLITTRHHCQRKHQRYS